MINNTIQTDRYRPLYRGTQAVWAILAVVDILLFVRFFLKILGAHEAAGFTGFIYIVTTPLATPFIYVFDLAAVNNSVIEWGTLLAIVIYTLIAVGIVKLLAMSRPVSTPEAAVKLEEEN